MITGTLAITTDLNMAKAAMFSGAKILLISEEPIQELVNTIPATILLPPYPSVMAELDGDIENAYGQYIGYLNSKEPSMFLAAVIAAALKGTNIVMVLGKNESEMKFGMWFVEYMEATYGIRMQINNSVQFMYNNAYDGVILTALYGYDLIGYVDFLTMYPYGLNLPKSLIPKLVMELNPYVENPTEESYTRYFENLKNHIKENNNQMLISPLLRG